METIKEIFNEIAEYFENITAGDSYVWIIVIAVILLVTLIGFIADRANKRKAKQAPVNDQAATQQVVEQPTNVAPVPPVQEPVATDNQVTNETEVVNNTPAVDPMIELGRAVNTPPVYTATNIPPAQKPVNMEPINEPPIQEPVNVEPIPPVNEPPIQEPVNMEPINEPQFTVNMNQ